MSDNENALDNTTVKVAGSRSNESNEEDGNEKPKRPLSAYNFFLKEERKKILKGMVNENTKTTTADTPNKESSSARRPMKKRRLVDPATDDMLNATLTSGETTSTNNTPNNEISFERIGKLIGERWQEVKAKPELFGKYEKLANDDHKRYAKEMKCYNDRKKNMLLSAVKSSENNEASPPKLPTVERPASNSPVVAQVSRGSSLQPSEDSEPEDKVPELELNTTQVPLINLQSLLAANLSQQQQHQGIPLEFLAAAASNQIPVTNPSLLAQLAGAQYPTLLRNNLHATNAAPHEGGTINLALLRQQEELAMLRQETLYRELMQMEQAKAYLSTAQGNPALQSLQQQQMVAAPYATNLEALLAQQSGLQYMQHPQQAQLLSLLSSHLQNQRNDENVPMPRMQLPQHEGSARGDEAHDDATSILMAYTDMMRRRQF